MYNKKLKLNVVSCCDTTFDENDSIINNKKILENNCFFIEEYDIMFEQTGSVYETILLIIENYNLNVDDILHLIKKGFITKNMIICIQEELKDLNIIDNILIKNNLI